jgi:hypothetical protein
LLGYSAREGLRRNRVHTALGSEEGYVLEVAEFMALGTVLQRFRVHVFDLGYDDIDGLVGLKPVGRAGLSPSRLRSRANRVTSAQGARNAISIVDQLAAAGTLTPNVLRLDLQLASSPGRWLVVRTIATPTVR